MPVFAPMQIRTSRLGRWFLYERHVRGCRCSYCQHHEHDGPWSVGVTLPVDKGWNSWRVFFLVRTDGVYYLRWMGFWNGWLVFVGLMFLAGVLIGRQC